jgi:hypothetical protein
MEKWTKKATPERYLRSWPNGPEAELAKEILGVSEAPPKESIKVRFFSPRASGLNIIVHAKEWFTQQTPSGSRTIQSKGKSAQFVNSLFNTEDPDIIEYLTNTYKDKRFPVVRDDIRTASVA